MNKQQTIETLQKQLPSFYSLEQVINIIEGIEDNNNASIEDLIEGVIKNTQRELYAESARLIDFGSANFDLSHDNRIELNCVDIDIDKILDIFEEELKQAVVVSERDTVELEKGE